ncbi:MAG: hypothetical protein WDA16_13055, partial [Candidatus Thermoplasmatota archaeon]
MSRLWVPTPSLTDPTTHLPVIAPTTDVQLPLSSTCVVFGNGAAASCVFACSAGDFLSVSAQGAPGFAFAKRSIEAKCGSIRTTCEGYGGCTQHSTTRVALGATGVCVATVTGTIAQCGASGGTARSVGPSPAPIIPPNLYLEIYNAQNA